MRERRLRLSFYFGFWFPTQVKPLEQHNPDLATQRQALSCAIPEGRYHDRARGRGYRPVLSTFQVFKSISKIGTNELGFHWFQRPNKNPLLLPKRRASKEKEESNKNVHLSPTPYWGVKQTSFPFSGEQKDEENKHFHLGNPQFQQPLSPFFFTFLAPYLNLSTRASQLLKY